MSAIVRVIGTAVAAFGLSMAAVAQDLPIETRIGEEGFESPPASLEQMDWLVGQWVGEGIAGAPALESWLPPTGGTMVGTFVQETTGEDGESAIMFTEHLYLMEEGGTLVLRLKHFNADLTGWEEKDGMLTFRLVAMEDCAAFFNALTLRCDGPDGLVAAVRMKSDKPEPQELLFRFKAVGAALASYDCDGTTVAINNCLSEALGRAKARQATYLEAALGSADNSSDLAEMIRTSDQEFTAYRERECNSVYEQWKEGTIRNAMSLRCSIRLTDQRTHDIWRNWLTYQDSTEPVLPEPEPTR